MAERSPPSDAEVEGALRKGIDLFNRHLFWECSEVLEAVWLRDRPPRRRFLQGLIKVAAGYHHLGNGNLLGMEHLLGAGWELLMPFRPRFMGIELEALLAAVGEHRAWAHAALGGRPVDPPTPPPLTLQTDRLHDGG